MEEKEALEKLTIENLMEHCLSQCSRHKNSKIGYEHYIFLRLLAVPVLVDGKPIVKIELIEGGECGYIFNLETIKE